MREGGGEPWRHNRLVYLLASGRVCGASFAKVDLHTFRGLSGWPEKSRTLRAVLDSYGAAGTGRRLPPPLRDRVQTPDCGDIKTLSIGQGWSRKEGGGLGTESSA